MLPTTPGAAYEPLTPDTMALIFIDLQMGPLTTVRTMKQEELKQNALALGRVAQMYQLPTLLTAGGQTGPGGAYLPELAQLFPQHVPIRRSTINAWATPAVVSAVEQTQRQKLVMAGLASDVGVLFCALSARAAGYTVYVVADVCGTITARSEQAAFTRMSQAGIILTSWSSMATELQQDFSREHGRELLGLISARLQEDL